MNSGIPWIFNCDQWVAHWKGDYNCVITVWQGKVWCVLAEGLSLLIAPSGPTQCDRMLRFRRGNAVHTVQDAIPDACWTQRLLDIRIFSILECYT